MVFKDSAMELKGSLQSSTLPNQLNRIPRPAESIPRSAESIPRSAESIPRSAESLSAFTDDEVKAFRNKERNRSFN
jgi:hypothetical protein